MKLGLDITNTHQPFLVWTFPLDVPFFGASMNSPSYSYIQQNGSKRKESTTTGKMANALGSWACQPNSNSSSIRTCGQSILASSTEMH